MKTLYSTSSPGSASGKCDPTLLACLSLFLFGAIAPFSTASAQAVLFDFDSAPQYTHLPIDQTAGGITAHFSGTGQGYSIQNANTLGFTPQGFAGNCIYPSSVYLADLLVSFDQPITDFSIMYSCQELGCDDAATMRVTAYMSGSVVGTSTRTATNPGTWPVDTLSCNFPQGFDSVVVHYDSHPPTCQDYGVIYLADNMRVTAMSTTAIAEMGGTFVPGSIFPNPVVRSTTISFSLLRPENIHAAIYDLTGHLTKDLFDARLSAGEHRIIWDAEDDAVEGGVYFLNLTGADFSFSYRILVVK